MASDQNEDQAANTGRKATAENPDATQYGADHITVLEGIDAVRKRPAMYIGDTGMRGYHHCCLLYTSDAADE